MGEISKEQLEALFEAKQALGDVMVQAQAVKDAVMESTALGPNFDWSGGSLDVLQEALRQGQGILSYVRREVVPVICKVRRKYDL